MTAKERRIAGLAAEDLEGWARELPLGSETRRDLHQTARAYASARSLQIGDGVAVIAVTSVAANLSTILAGLAVFGDRLGTDAFVVGVRVAAFALILIGAALIPAPVRAGEALGESAVESGRTTESRA